MHISKPRLILAALPAAALVGTAGLLGGFAPAPAAPGVSAEAPAAASYTVDKVHSSVVFGIRHAGVSNFYGVFRDFDGSFTSTPTTTSRARSASRS